MITRLSLLSLLLVSITPDIYTAASSSDGGAQAYITRDEFIEQKRQYDQDNPGDLTLKKLMAIALQSSICTNWTGGKNVSNLNATMRNNSDNPNIPREQLLKELRERLVDLYLTVPLTGDTPDEELAFLHEDLLSMLELLDRLDTFSEDILSDDDLAHRERTFRALWSCRKQIKEQKLSDADGLDYAQQHRNSVKSATIMNFITDSLYKQEWVERYRTLQQMSHEELHQLSDRQTALKEIQQECEKEQQTLQRVSRENLRQLSDRQAALRQIYDLEQQKEYDQNELKKWFVRLPKNQFLISNLFLLNTFDFKYNELKNYRNKLANIHELRITPECIRSLPAFNQTYQYSESTLSRSHYDYSCKNHDRHSAKVRSPKIDIRFHRVDGASINVLIQNPPPAGYAIIVNTELEMGIERWEQRSRDRERLSHKDAKESELHRALSGGNYYNPDRNREQTLTYQDALKEMRESLAILDMIPHNFDNIWPKDTPKTLAECVSMLEEEIAACEAKIQDGKTGTYNIYTADCPESLKKCTDFPYVMTERMRSGNIRPSVMSQKQVDDINRAWAQDFAQKQSWADWAIAKLYRHRYTIATAVAGYAGYCCLRDNYAAGTAQRAIEIAALAPELERAKEHVVQLSNIISAVQQAPLEQTLSVSAQQYAQALMTINSAHTRAAALTAASSAWGIPDTILSAIKGLISSKSLPVQASLATIAGMPLVDRNVTQRFFAYKPAKPARVKVFNDWHLSKNCNHSDHNYCVNQTARWPSTSDCCAREQKHLLNQAPLQDKQLNDIFAQRRDTLKGVLASSALLLIAYTAHSYSGCGK